MSRVRLNTGLVSRTLLKNRTNYFNAKIIFTRTAIKTYSNNKVNDAIKVRQEMYGTNYFILPCSVV